MSREFRVASFECHCCCTHTLRILSHKFVCDSCYEIFAHRCYAKTKEGYRCLNMTLNDVCTLHDVYNAKAYEWESCPTCNWQKVKDETCTFCKNRLQEEKHAYDWYEKPWGGR